MALVLKILVSEPLIPRVLLYIVYIKANKLTTIKWFFIDLISKKEDYLNLLFIHLKFLL